MRSPEEFQGRKMNRTNMENEQKLLDKIQLLEELSTARKELDNDEGVSQEQFFNELRADYSS